MKKGIALTYDDIQLIPEYSQVQSRNHIKLHTLLSRRYGLVVPLVASPMDTVCELEMAHKLFLLGGVGCIHRFMSIEEQVKQISELSRRIHHENQEIIEYMWGVMYDNWHAEINQVPVMAAIGVGEVDKQRAEALVAAGANVLLIDVAHGHHIKVKNMIEWCKNNLAEYVDIIAGNIATKDAAYDLQDWGADGLRVGIGGGSLCTTRVKTGFGIPNVTALESVLAINKVPVMADGGLRSSGDIAKALALGADCVMLGSMLAGTEESPGRIIETPTGLYKMYRGSASLETKVKHGQQERNVEGESTTIPYKGGVKFIINGVLDGLRSALSYAGAQTLSNYCPSYVVITHSGIIEAKPHAKL